MLQLKDITKTYTTASFEQTALDGLSVTFRDNEFAAILGPSGSGKTTLLNIVGGLDHADSGELLIEGISTELYKDRDWDTYRNNRIGFVFQSYNLITHQTVLANVELALTLSGVSNAERQSRAIQVLKEVGLADHIHKKPSQLSGGQMQRVAIARALVNDPEIVLADEPTGALDSKTSLQIMDLLTHIAKDRLVIMVTHNSDLADTYANRTLTLSDGRLVSDSNPYTPETMQAGSGEAIKHTSMNFLTSLSLSFSNLMTKKGRTIMTAFAGSIGIIGIAAILALANGVQEYIKDVEESTLSQYPLSITRSGIDLTTMLVGSNRAEGNEGNEGNEGSDNPHHSSGSQNSDDGTLREIKLLSSVFKSITTNDLEALRVFLDDKSQSAIDRYVNAIEYAYDLTPQIYLGNTSKKVWQVNPDIMSRMMDPSAASMGSSSSAWSFGMNMSIFNSMPRNTSLVTDQYNVLAGKWPVAYNECVIVLAPGERISDYVSYVLGLRDPDLLQQMFDDFMDQKNVTPPIDNRTFTFQDYLDVDLRLVLAPDYYSYDSVYNVYVDHRDDQNYLKDLINDSERLHIVGVIAPKPDSALTPLRPGINYLPELTDYLMEKAAEKDIVKSQLAQPDTDVFTGKTFSQINSEGGLADFDMSKMLTIDEDALGSAFKFDAGSLGNIDFTKALDLDSLMANMPGLPAIDLTSVLASQGMGSFQLRGLSDFAGRVLGDYLASRSSASDPDTQHVLNGFSQYLQQPEVRTSLAAIPANAIGSPGLNDLAANTIARYMQYCGMHGITDPGIMIAQFPAWLEPQVPALEAALQQSLDSAMIMQINGLINIYLTQVGYAPHSSSGTRTGDFSLWLSQPDVSAQVQNYFSASVNTDPLLQSISTLFNTYLQQTVSGFMTQFMTALQQQLSTAITNSMNQLTSSMGFSPDLFEKIFQFNMDQDQLAQLMLSLMGAQKNCESNLKLLGYANPDDPSSISIYPKDFESKQQVLNILDDYNSRMKSSGAEDQVIVYTDIVGALMSSVTTIINMISAVLVAFVTISLIVSSIMIGIVTYISVLERKKEIGILRSIGASKLNVGTVFVAETLIIGLTAGIIGIVITALMCIPANIIVEAKFDVANLAQLPPIPSIMLIGVSCLLSLVAGLIPSFAASRRDPVEALRSE
ncbi:MAG: ABC transporter ATP-binding protein/permease [Peptococcaceae bacterium]|nr:ABC transporter ATP-binding protein/permease [Peptococcaceae bacterium]